MTRPGGAATLHPSVERALAVFPNDIGRRAAAALRTALEGRVVSDGERAWSSSRLTGDGFPVEFAFATADNRLRCTVEPASLRLAPQRRLDAAIRLIGSLDDVAIPDDVTGVLRRTQERGGLSYGAWLGCRHGPGESVYKLYVEVPDGEGPPDSVEVMPWLAGLRPRLPDRVANLRMLSYSPASQQYEAYFRIRSLEPHHLPRVLAPAGLDSRAGELLRYITGAYGFPLRQRLPGQSVGVSYSTDSRGGPRSVTLHLFARALWGSDASIRRRFGSLSRALGWDDRRYQTITTALEARHRWTTYHGILGITLTDQKRLSLSIGVRPPEGAL